MRNHLRLLNFDNAVSDIAESGTIIKSNVKQNAIDRKALKQTSIKDLGNM